MKGEPIMSSKKTPSTPEARAEKLANKQMLRKAFTSTFFKALAVCLSALLVCSIVYIAFINPSQLELQVGESTGGNNAVSVGNQVAGGDASSDGAASQLPTVTELTASSSQEEILSYFNDAINKVKAGNNTITQNREVNSQSKDAEGEFPLIITAGVVNSVIGAFMGEKAASDLPAPASTAEAKNAMFPVENESWSSKLTIDDISSATVTDTGSAYEITINVKEDAPSADTAHGVGHNGKVFSVIETSIIMDNIPSIASGIVSSAETGHSNGVVKVTVDKATGNVTAANYYFDWTLHLTGSGLDCYLYFGLEKDFSIAWN